MGNRVKYNGIIATHPGGVIEGFLEDTNMSVEELSKQSGIELDILQKFINAEIEINEDIAEKLSPITGFKPDLLMKFQDRYYTKLKDIYELKENAKSKLFSASKYLVNKYGEMDIAKLQKLIYYCESWHLAFMSKPMFEYDFQAWANGPICPELYNFCKRHDEFEISIDNFKDIEPPELTKEEKKIVDFVIKKYGNMTAKELSEATHKERPWLEARENIPTGAKSTNTIKKITMWDYYGAFTSTVNF